MSGWGGGYVTDVEYTSGYYLAQSPHMMAVTCLMNGLAVDPPWHDPHLHYLELGCGRGVNACVLAASNPGWRVTAIDFNPGAIADARRLAQAAGLDNVTFIEADLAGFAATAAAAALPPVDAISMHGVWSWVGEPVRAGIKQLAAAKLRAGGMLHVSYIGLPAMQGALGMQRLLREAGTRLAGRSDRQAVAGRGVVQALLAAEAAHLALPVARELIERLDALPVAYLAHEYMNASWTPFFHADVASALAEAKLDYAGSARLHENFVDLMLSPAQRAVHDRFDDPLMRELVLDTCTNRTLRHDVYVRGATRIAAGVRDAALGDVTLALAVMPDEFTYKVEVPAGSGTLNPEFYGPVVRALAERPRRVADLLALPDLAGKRDNPSEMITMLAGTYRALIAQHLEQGASDRIRRYNAVIARRDVRLDGLNNPSAMASLRLGAGYPCRAVELFLVDRIGAAGGAIDPALLAAELDPSLSAQDSATLAGVFANVLRDRLDVWRAMGLV